MQSSSDSGSRGQWEEYVEQAREKLPAPPPNVMDIYCKWIPWIAIILGGIGFLFIVFVGLLGAVLLPFLALSGAEGVKAGFSTIFALVLGGISSALSFVAGWKMKQMNATGWWIFAVSLVISVLSDLVTFNMVGLLIALALAWIHVHVRPRYL